MCCCDGGSLSVRLLKPTEHPTPSVNLSVNYGPLLNRLCPRTLASGDKCTLCSGVLMTGAAVQV